MTAMRATSLVLMLGAAAGLAACGRHERRESTSSAMPGAGAIRPGAGEAVTGVHQGRSDAAEGAGSAARDAAITTRVRSRLASDSRFSALDIQVETNQGRVRLRGATPDTDVRRHAARLASGVAGVVDVHNDLSVQVPGR